MSDELVIPDLRGWEACLAFAEQRLGRPDFHLDVNHAFDFSKGGQAPPEHWVLHASVHDLSIKVLRAGHQLVRVQMLLDGTLTAGAKTYEFKDAHWDVVTSFQVVRKGECWDVVANLADRHREQTVTASCCDLALETAVSRWTENHKNEHPFPLFSFRGGAGPGGRMGFTQFQVTTSFPEVSPEYPSFLLLMSDSPQSVSATPPIIDPHILPQGETAVLWIDRQTLERSHGLEVANQAEEQLTLRARHLGVDIPCVTSALSQWARSIIDLVSLPKPLEFTSMQMGKGGLKLSATPLSLNELDQLTASDLTISHENLVQQKAGQFFHDCVLFHLDERYRKYLLGEKQPKLPVEIGEVAGPHAKWLQDFGRLQVALLAKGSYEGSVAPYSRLSVETIKKKLRHLARKEECKELMEKLYALAFCVVRPRLSLYRDQCETWLPRYQAHLEDEGYIERLLQLDDPVGRIHDDAAKLSLLDRDGGRAHEFLSKALPSFLDWHAKKNWKIAVGTYPAVFRDTLEHLLSGLGGEWIAQAGGAKGVTGELVPELTKEAATPRLSPLKDLVTRFAGARRWVAKGAADTLVHAAQWAAFAVLVAPTRAVAANASLGNLQPFADEIANYFVKAAQDGSIPAEAWKDTTIASVVIVGSKGLRWIAKNITQGAREAAEFFQTSVGRCFSVAGAALSLASFGCAIWDLYEDLKAGDATGAILDGVAALGSAVSFIAFVMQLSVTTGPYAPFVAAAGLLIAAICFIWKLCRQETEQEKAAKALVAAIEVMHTE